MLRHFPASSDNFKYLSLRPVAASINPTVEASARFGDSHTDAVDIKALQDIVELALLPRRKHSAERELDATKDRLTEAGTMTALERSAFEQSYQATRLDLTAWQVRLRTKREVVNVRP